MHAVSTVLIAIRITSTEQKIVNICRIFQENDTDWPSRPVRTVYYVYQGYGVSCCDFCLLRIKLRVSCVVMTTLHHSSLRLSNCLLFGFFNIITQPSDTTYNCVPQFEIMCVICALRALVSVLIITFSARQRHATAWVREQNKKEETKTK